MYVGIIIGVLLIVFVWLTLDYKHGRKSHLQTAKNHEYPIRHSDLTLFTNGENLYENLFTEIKAAKKHIHILFYIVGHDRISRDFLDLLMTKARNGVEVRLLIDWVGGHKVPRKKIRALKESGVQFYHSHIPRLPYLFYSLNVRNHRKISIIDGKVGYVGGFNIGQEYLGEDPKYGTWRDYHLKMEGEGVQDLQKQFLHDWCSASKLDLMSNQSYFPPLHQGQMMMKMVPTDGLYLKDSMIHLLRLAKDEILIGTPYFIPGKDITEELGRATARGIKVKILFPRIADHLLVKDGAFPYIKKLKKEGVQFFFYEEGFYHAKLLVIDDKICDIGTANLDKRSLFLNYEINCFVYDKEFVQEVKDKLRKDLSDSTFITDKEIKKRTLTDRIRESFATLVSNFL